MIVALVSIGGIAVAVIQGATLPLPLLSGLCLVLRQGCRLAEG